jgi:hypothetical protein
MVIWYSILRSNGLVIIGQMAPPPILVDEWQHVPSSPTHSGAGRIVTVRMRPLALSERGLSTPTVSLQELLQGTHPTVAGQTTIDLVTYAQEIIRSGFPGLRHLKGRALRAQLDGYLARIVDRDFLEQGHPVRKPETLRRWMTAGRITASVDC